MSWAKRALGKAKGSVSSAFDKDWSDPKTYAAAVLSYYGAGALTSQLGVTGAAAPGSAGTMGVNGVVNPLSTIPGTAATVAGFTATAPQKLPDPTMESAPTIDETNDPSLAAQFKRMRAAARALGRAGTIKNKGSSSLGGDSPLGSNMTLQGV